MRLCGTFCPLLISLNITTCESIHSAANDKTSFFIMTAYPSTCMYPAFSIHLLIEGCFIFLVIARRSAERCLFEKFPLDTRSWDCWIWRHFSRTLQAGFYTGCTGLHLPRMPGHAFPHFLTGTCYFSFCLSDYNIVNWSEVILYCGFHLHFPNGSWCWELLLCTCWLFACLPLRSVSLDLLSIFDWIICEASLSYNIKGHAVDSPKRGKCNIWNTNCVKSNFC